ncbi:hypothetical protein [Spiroplasma sp. AdecLV25b]|uniref:hypothetical protein n=1 Tax=Spiroplasma sp. AdecLV25b TaxID=3027162 RepID=UPI0027E12CC2|nr:hypothetical protein [Spiroplasma sp. AdecLV25b]
MKTQYKFIIGSGVFGEVIGNIAVWYSIPTMFSEWLNIMEYDFIDNYINNDLNPYSSTFKGVAIWGLLGACGTILLSSATLATVAFFKNKICTTESVVSDEDPLLPPVPVEIVIEQSNSLNNSANNEQGNNENISFVVA